MSARAFFFLSVLALASCATQSEHRWLCGNTSAEDIKWMNEHGHQVRYNILIRDNGEDCNYDGIDMGCTKANNLYYEHLRRNKAEPCASPQWVADKLHEILCGVDYVPTN